MSSISTYVLLINPDDDQFIWNTNTKKLIMNRPILDADHLIDISDSIRTAKAILSNVEPLSKAEEFGTLVERLYELLQRLSQINIMFADATFTKSGYVQACQLLQEHGSIIQDGLQFTVGFLHRIESPEEEDTSNPAHPDLSKGSYNQLQRKKNSGQSKIVVSCDSEQNSKFTESYDSQVQFFARESESELPSQYTWMKEKEHPNPFHAESRSLTASRFNDLRYVINQFENLEKERAKIILQEHNHLQTGQPNLYPSDQAHLQTIRETVTDDSVVKKGKFKCQECPSKIKYGICIGFFLSVVISLVISLAIFL